MDSALYIELLNMISGLQKMYLKKLREVRYELEYCERQKGVCFTRTIARREWALQEEYQSLHREKIRVNAYLYKLIDSHCS